ncbi:MAG: hypothetical protein ACJAVI_004081 [Candidatus Azotimanducaceae bacterium]|jgi:hypothetical protein
MISLPMQQHQLEAESQQLAKADYEDIYHVRNASGGGIYDIVGDKRSPLDISKTEREQLLQRAWRRHIKPSIKPHGV